MGLGRRPRQVGYVLRNVFVKGSFYGGLVETGKHTALKMRSRKASGFKSLALYHCDLTQ